jgi:monofunctional glycosyltransferase
MNFKNTCLIGLVTLFIMSALAIGGIPFSKIDLLKKGTVQVFPLEELKNRYVITKNSSRQWVKISRMSDKAIHAIVINEDWAFYNHPGVDTAQIQTAIKDVIYSGKKWRGASTITQQLSKNLFLDHSFSFWRKWKELGISLYLDATLSKKKILETYLNIIEFGKNIYGIKAAAWHYFRKHPMELTPREGAYLAVLLPSPVRYSQSFKRGELTPFMKDGVDKVLMKMKIAKIISLEEFRQEKDTPFLWER